MSAFTIAFQVPNLVRALFADAALQGAFVPVFTELLEKGQQARRRSRSRRALFSLITLVLGALTLLFILSRRAIMPLFAPGFDDHPALRDLTVDLIAGDVPDRPAAGADAAWSSGCSTRSSTSACRRSRRWPGTW